jgi:hypothetical protein
MEPSRYDHPVLGSPRSLVTAISLIWKVLSEMPLLVMVAMVWSQSSPATTKPRPDCSRSQIFAIGEDWTGPHWDHIISQDRK